MTLYSNAAVSQSTPRAVTVYVCLTTHKLPAAITSFHQHSQAHSQHQQAPAVGGHGWEPPCRGLRCEALARCRQMRRTWAVTCCVAHAQCWSAGPATAVSCSRFLRELAVFIPRNSGTENDRDSRAPGKREPGNPHPIEDGHLWVAVDMTVLF